MARSDIVLRGKKKKKKEIKDLKAISNSL